LELQIDRTKEYGLVLEGGGAKGAYQIGAWKALREAGILIKGVAGSSVGALNGALICMDDLDTAEYIWENISYSKVMDIDDNMMESVRNWDLKSIDMGLLTEEIRKILHDRGLDITPLRKLISQTVDEDRIRNSGKDLFITTYSVSDRRLLTVSADQIPKGQIGDMLMASAYLPVFKREPLGGKKYLDGGGWNNVPTDPLLDHQYRDIIIIRIYGLGFDSEKVTEIPEGTRVYHIAPRQNLGGMLRFDKQLARKNMRLGYYDATRFLYDLKGKWYYLDAPEPESWYFDQLVKEADLLKNRMPPELFAVLKEGEEKMPGYRYYMEVLFPMLARHWSLKPDWDYKELYLTFLENAARRRRISRFCVYRPSELMEKVKLA
jgi:NTE family protein